MYRISCCPHADYILPTTQSLSKPRLTVVEKRKPYALAVSRSPFNPLNANHKVRHPRCVYNKLDWSLYTCLTQLYGDIDMYSLLHKDQLHVSALFIGHLHVDN